jgi:L-ascorbate metabolism protein UlaG (beta-lactamase superfamily)
MKKIIFLTVVLVVVLGIHLRGSEGGQITFKWYGQACFLIVTSQGTKIITDPVSMGEYKLPRDIQPDVVTVSHEHFDHNQVEAVPGKPLVIRGLKTGEKEVAQVETKVKDVRIFTVASCHDDSRGKERGLNAIFVFEFDGIRVAHLGDLGHILTEEQIAKIGPLDVLMIPVGGKFTIYGEDADRVIAQLEPKLVVFPMHYATAVANFLPYTGEDFTREKKNVKKLGGNAYVLDLNRPPRTREYVLLDYK